MSKDEAYYIPMPEEYSRRKLNALYREIPLKDTTSRLLRKYFNAAANLYGIIPLSKLYEIITVQNKALVTEAEFLAFAEIAKHENEEFYILGKSDLYCDGPKTPLMEYEVIDVALIGDNLEEYHEILRGHQGKQYYVPEKKVFLAYDSPFYWEQTKEAIALREFLLSKTNLKDDKLDTVFEDICYGTRCSNAGVQEVMERLHKQGVEFRRNRDVNAFVEIFQAFHNNSRMQYNRGYTPHEMSAMIPPEDRVPKSISLGPNIRKAIADGTMDADELKKQILTMDMPNEMLRFSLLKELADASKTAVPKAKKVGRNELCPCGSGKKYKHCCGK